MKSLRTNAELIISKAFNLPGLKKSRLHWVDYLRGIAIILIVYRHVFIGISRSGLPAHHYLLTANEIFMSFRLPLFFILSGLFLNASLKKRTVKQFIEAKFDLLIYPYFIWATIQVTIQILSSQFTNSDRSWIDYTYILYRPREIDQFWYLPALFNITILYFLLKIYVRPPVYVQLLLGLFFYFLSPHVQEIKASVFTDWMIYYFFFAIGDAISSVFFKENWQKVFNSKYILIGIVPIFLLSQIVYLRYHIDFESADPAVQTGYMMIALIGCFGMFLVALRLQKYGGLKILRIIGFHSLYIYIMHVIIIAFIRIFMTKFLGVYNAEVILFISIAVGVTLPVAIYNLFLKNGIAWFLITYHKPKPRPVPPLEFPELKQPAAMAS